MKQTVTMPLTAWSSYSGAPEKPAGASPHNLRSVGSGHALDPVPQDGPSTGRTRAPGIRFSAYVNYAPDLAIPGAKEAIRAFVDKAVAKGVQHLVLLSGRGEEEAQACERIIQEAGVEWTVVRASWFNQNFSEGEFLGMVQDGVIALPTADIPEPFVDVNDIADVVVAALTEEGHAFEVYEVTGPRMLTFAELAKAISVALGREVQFVEVPRETFSAAIADSGAPQEIVWLTDYLFSTVLDGRNAYISDGIERALGRPPRDFSDFAREIAATGVWEAVA